MKFYYPKFLKKGPNFVGLSILDLMILIVALLVSVFMNLSSLQSLGAVLAIAISKIVALKFPRGHFQHYFLKRSILHWQKELNKLSQGIFI
jgi:hypothetical protein